MSTILQHRRGTTAQHATFTGAAGEVTVDTTKNTVVVHDNATAGGFPLARETGGNINYQSINGGPFSGSRNAFINAEFAVDIQNSGGSHTYTAGAALDYGGIDRWYGYCTGANVAGQRVAGSGNSQYRYQFTGAASVTGIGLGQRMTASNTYRYAGTTATLAIDIANSLLTTVNWAAYYANSTDSFGTLASPTRTAIASGSFTVSSGVSRYYAPVAIPAAATTGLEVVFSVGAQISGTWQIGKAFLIPGTVNESYMEPRPYEIDAALCRYYSQYIDVEFSGATTLSSGYDVRTTAPMRATPSCISATDIYAASGFPVAATSQYDAANSSSNSFRIGRGATSTGVSYFAGRYLMKAEL